MSFGALVGDGAAAAALEQWVVAAGWARAGSISGLVSDWHEIAGRHPHTGHA